MVLFAKGCGASSGFEAWPCNCRPEKGNGRSRVRGGKKSMASEYPVYIIDPEKKLPLPVPFEVVMPCFLNGS
jgi:phosphoribosyl 1,2-cyclic phosphodiesterase